METDVLHKGERHLILQTLRREDNGQRSPSNAPKADDKGLGALYDCRMGKDTWGTGGMNS